MSKNRNLKSFGCFQAIDKLRNWSTAILLVLMSSISQFAEAQILPSRPIEKRETAQKPRKDFRPSYSSPDMLNIPSGMTEAQVMAIIKQAARTAKANVNPSANPDIPESLLCEDLKVIFVLDESGSISTSEANLVRTGALALANALNNSGAELRVVEFNTTSSIVNLGSTLVTPSFITSFNNYLYATSGTRYRPVSSGCTGWTNWEDALDDVQTLDGDLVIFFTDGNPTAYNVATSGGCSSGQVTSGNDNSYSATTALNRAITEANVIKGQGKHMFVAAVGSDLNLDNCIDISGPDDFSVTGSIFTADYTIGGFETLAANLAAAANSICGTELTINKTASATGVCSGETVQFTIQVTNTGGDYNFTAFNVQIEDVFPNGFSNIAFVGAAPSGASITGNTLTYNLASLAANASVSVTVSATVDVPPGNFNNIATAIADNANEVSDNASVVSGYATETLTISECSPITVNGVIYSSTGSYTQQLVSSVGCDSILTIDFTLKSATTSSTEVSSCGSYSWNGTSYSQSGVYTYTTTNAAGCDSVATLNLTVTQVPDQPSIACYQVATFNPQTCSWSVSGDMPAEPTGLACYQDAVFNTTTCSWDVTGEMPAQPSIACYESASFNGQTCSWDVTGDMPAQPSIACYESASFNGQTCSWDVTGDMPAQPSIACYESASFNGQTCSWDVTGDMPAQPSIACYESASFNGQTCSWDVTGDMPAQPSIACYESASFNGQTCSWDVTGEMPAQPSIACYESASFNGQTCSWDVTGEMPAQPSIACYESASFNGQTCSWDVTGDMPAQPSIACYESASFNGQTCSWDVTGEMPAQPSIACYESASFNGQTCSWDVTGEMPAQPSIACYESASFNGQTCSWDVTGEMPAQPSIACYESASFNGQTCSWDVTGDMPAQPSIACYESVSFNGQTCSWDVTGEMPAQPSIACYESASFNGQTCSWDVTGDMPAQPSIACYESASFNGQTCSWDITGDMPAQPSIACYESASFNGQTCSWDVTGEPNPAVVTNASTCSTYVWSVNGETYASSGTFNFAADCQDYVLNLTVNVATTYSFAVSINRGDIYNFNGQTISEAGVYTSTLTNAAGCDSVVTVEVIVNEIVNGCYAVEVYNFTQGLTKLGTAVNPERSIPNNALGAPNGQTPTAIAPVQNFFSLGFGGSVELRFADPIANGPGADLKIWESSASPNAEKAQILVSQDGLGYVPVGTVDMGGEVDFGAAFGDYIQFVKIVDISNPAQFSNVQVSDGYDVDAIECIHGRYSAPNCNANVVVSFNQGKRADGSDVIAIRSNPEKALGAPEVSTVGFVDFFALGFGGQITVDFGSPVANGAGDDIRVTETTWNFTCANYPETADVFASQDGLNFVFLGRTCMSNTFDLGGLAWAQYIKVVDASDASLFPMDADGYDVNAIECLHPGVEFLPIPEDFTPCSATEVITYNPGKCKNGNNVPVIRSNANNALGAPQSNDTYNFVSLGFGGSLTLKYDFVIFNLSGDDIRVIETSFGNPICQNYPEHATISVSMDGVNFTDLGELCLDGTIDLGSVPYAQYIKITDISNTANFGGSADGYDVDAVVVLNGPCSVSGARMAAIDNTTIADETLEMSMYPNPATEFTVISLDGSREGETFNVELFDGAGRLISADSFSANGVNAQYFLQVNALESGVYTVRVSNANEQFVQRLVK